MPHWNLRVAFGLTSAVMLALIPGKAIAFADEPNQLPALIAKVRPSVATIRVQGRDGDELGIGTGFVVDAEGLIVTNYHVINEGRRFSVELGGKKLKVLAVEASDREADLAVIRVQAKTPLAALERSEQVSAQQGVRVLAFGNPLGLKDSVVEGIVSAVRDVQGRELIQLAMPVEPGNSGGPLVDMDGRVLGVINMKSAVDDNLGFAIPINSLTPLLEKPNPVLIDRWVRLGTINPARWKPLMGATWQERGGLITARGMGSGFGGRSLCLSTNEPPASAFEVAVAVRLDNESGAAGIALQSDGEDRHYGFYPSNGRLRLTCFKGKSVYSWQVLEEVDSEHYLPAQWNRLRVKVGDGKLKCFVNDHLVIESSDQQLKSGRVGLVKFRNTNPDFKAFQVGKELSAQPLSQAAAAWLAKLDQKHITADQVNDTDLKELGHAGDAASQALRKRAIALENEAARLRQLASDVRLAPSLTALKQLFDDDAHDDKKLESDPSGRLLTATLLVAQLDDPDLDIDYYKNHLDEMADEILGGVEGTAGELAKRERLDEYLFQENGFHGGRSEYYHPANSHLNRVLDDREGLPITLSIVYIELARRLGLTMEGVGLPGHFVVRHVWGEESQLIDVFEGGIDLSKREAKQTVRDFAGRALREQDLRSQTDQEIVTRVLRNLLGIASDSEDLEAMLRYVEGLVAVNPEAVDYRMMRLQLRSMTSRKTRAKDDIDWLLKKDPPGLDQDRLKGIRSAIEG